VSLLSTPAILLRSYPYSETSQVLRFYTEQRGALSAMAKGVRKSGGRRGGTLSTFSEGLLSVHYRESRDLQTFRDYLPSHPRRGLGQSPLRLAGASVLGELILQHAEAEGNPELFGALGRGLDCMETEEPGALLQGLLVHLWSLIVDLGFGPMVQVCVECGREIVQEEMGRFDFGAGGIRCPDCPGENQGPRLGPLARAQLLSLLAGIRPPELVRPKTHLRLASDFITYHVSGGTPLRAMAVLADLVPDDDA